MLFGFLCTVIATMLAVVATYDRKTEHYA